MEHYNITDNHRQRAKNLYDFKALNKSIMGGGCNIIGALGEVMIQDIFKGNEIDTASTYDYDLKIGNIKFDVKTGKVTTAPKNHYNVKIPAYQKRQQTDYYFFGYVTADLKNYYLAGYIEKKQFFNIADLKKKDDTDEGFLFRCDCYVLKADKLKIFY